MKSILFIMFFIGCSFNLKPNIIQAQSAYFFITPKIGTGVSRVDGFRPKYISGESLISSYSCMDIGLEPFFLVRAVMTETHRDSIVGFSDVIAFAKDINTNLSAGAVTVVRSKLEAIKIPSNWVTTATTYKQLIRFIAVLAQMHQRFNGLFKTKLLPSGVTLSTTFSQLPQAGKNRLNALADSFGFSKANITGSSTLRFILKELIRQWSARISLGNQVL